MAKLYAYSYATYQECDDVQKQQFKLLVVDTSKTGVERTVNDPMAIPPPLPQIYPPDVSYLKDIHDGRFNFPTASGSKLVAQVFNFS